MREAQERPEQEKLTYDQWVEKYKPIQNEWVDGDVAYEGCMFETFGEECERARQAAKTGRCWTIVECDNPEYDSIAAEYHEENGLEYGVRDNLVVIQSGWHFVNRIGYLITEVPFVGDYLEVEDEI